jgi:hypothetical protein
MSNLTATAKTVAITADGELTALHEATRETLPAKPLSPAVHRAWMRLPEVHGTVRLPEADKPWTPAETVNAHETMRIAKNLRRAAETIEATVREGVLLTIDQDAERRAAVDQAFAAVLDKAPRDGNGHYILGEAGRPAHLPVPGSDTEVFSAEYTVGRPQMTVEALEELVANHTLSRREYRKLTRTIRVVDPTAVQRETGRNFGLRERLRSAWKSSTPRIAVHLREIKPTATI